MFTNQIMKCFKLLILSLLIGLFKLTPVIGQCNTNTNLCQAVSGPFNFVSPGVQVSSCLDFFGPGYGYIVLYITQSGPLNLLIDGDALSGYLDVAIFNIPDGEDPCDAILDVSNEISCNYATNSSGCNQIGSYFACPSSITAPNVLDGDRLMIVVENWSGSSTNFSLQMAPLPSAQSGQADPTIDTLNQVLNAGSSPYQMSAADNGGVWSGFGITVDGLFDPFITGEGSFDVVYEIGIGPCAVSDTFTIVVNSILAVSLINFSATCEGNKTFLIWETLSEKNSDYFKIEYSEDGLEFKTIGTVKSQGNSSVKIQYYFKHQSNFVSGYYKLIEVDLNGLEVQYNPFSSICDVSEFEIYPNPVTYELFVNLEKNYNEFISYEIRTISGKVLEFKELEGSINVSDLPTGLYILKIQTSNKVYIRKFVHE